MYDSKPQVMKFRTDHVWTLVILSGGMGGGGGGQAKDLLRGRLTAFSVKVFFVSLTTVGYFGKIT